MANRRNSIAILTCIAVLCATASLCRSPHVPRSAGTSRVEQRETETAADFSGLIALIEAETERTPQDDFALAPAVSTAAEISDSDRAEILNLIITDVLSSPDFQDSRDFYGTPGAHSAVLLTHGDVRWPPRFQATVAGWKIEHRRSPVDSDPHAPRVVAIRFDKFAPHRPANLIFDGHVSLCIFNGGGNPDGTIHIGGCLAYYRVERSHGQWSVACVYAIDP